MDFQFIFKSVICPFKGVKPGKDIFLIVNRSIITITLNPSIDVTLWTDGISFDKANRVLSETREVGGKGINVSRVSHSFGLQTRCLTLTGKENCREFSGYLESEKLRYEPILIEGAVRENLTLRYDGNTAKVNRKGPSVSVMMIEALMSLIKSRVHPGDVVVFAGSLPQNISVNQYVELITAVKHIGVLVAVDNDMLSLDDYRRISPWLIKPNIHELKNIINFSGNSIDEIADAALVLCKNGVENVLVSLGADGILFLSKGRAIRAAVPAVEVKSTVGAGDSVLAGFIIGFMKESSVEECVRLAAACGTASAMQEGTKLATRETVQVLLEQITITELSK